MVMRWAAVASVAVLSVAVDVVYSQDCAVAQELTAPDAGMSDQYGRAVATNGEFVVVAARRNDLMGQDAGAVFVYHKDGGAWALHQTLTAPQPQPFDQFGHALAMDATRLVIGAPVVVDDADGPGALYTYELQGGLWQFHSQIAADDGQIDDQFGSALDLNGDELAVGAQRVQERRGAVYVFSLNAGTWTQSAKLMADDALSGEQLGASVAFDGDWIAAGAYLANGQNGNARVFRRSGSVWTFVQTLVPPEAEDDQGRFGTSCRFAANELLIGEPEDDVGSWD